jgi:HlyD family secretion protein/macrolide-specific efflux system membrane fusion protein
LIAIIDNRELKQGLDRAEAALRKVRATFENSIREQELEIQRQRLKESNARKELAAAEGELRFREWDFKSLKRLFSKATHSTSEKAFRKAKDDLVRARMHLGQARNDLKAAALAVKKAETALARLKQEYRESLKMAQADLGKARIRFSYSILRAPFSGIITYVSTQEGETVVAGLNAPQFVKILDESRIEDWVYVDETDIGKISEGMKVVFHVDAYLDHSYEGIISQIYPAPVIQNNVIYYIAIVTGFENRPGLKLQMTTHNRIMVKTLNDVLLVPNSAVRFMDGRYVVLVREGNGIETVPVEIGASDERFTEIRSGLKEGQKVLYKR